MRKFKLRVEEYRAKLERDYGWADPEQVKRYAIARAAHRLAIKNGTETEEKDTCKSCRITTDE